MNWEPLPPRSSRRRAYESSANMSTDANKEEQNNERPKNRPGFNSYLRVNLHDSAMRSFHDVTLEIQDKLQAAHDAEKSEAEAANVTYIQKRPIRIRPRSLDSLHLTLFFGGEVLCELPPDELSEWHANVATRLEQSGFALDGKSFFRTDAHPDDYFFSVKEIRTFPPTRHNLLVAILETGLALHKVHDDIRDLAEKSPGQKLKSVLDRSFELWTPHITLASVVPGTGGSSRQQRKSIRKVLKTMNLNERDAIAGSHKVTGISMGGPVPEQVPLDWNFRFRLRDRPKAPWLEG